MTRILRIDASARYEGSVSRMLADETLAALQAAHPGAQVATRDVAQGVEFVDADWVGANLTPEEDRSGAQKTRLAGSDELIAEVQNADILLISAPIYNFGVPAALKAWVDQICRARKTFRYTGSGPEGLLKGKRAILIVASGGTAVDSEIDFATPYLRHIMGFIGITDVRIVKAERQMAQADESIAAGRAAIAAAVQDKDAT